MVAAEEQDHAAWQKTKLIERMRTCILKGKNREMARDQKFTPGALQHLHRKAIDFGFD